MWTIGILCTHARERLMVFADDVRFEMSRLDIGKGSWVISKISLS